MLLNFMSLDITHELKQKKTPTEAGRGDHMWIGGSGSRSNINQ